MKVIKFEAWHDVAGDLLERDILPAPLGNKGGKKAKYVDCISAFDIETSTITAQDGEKHAFMYVWQWCFYELGYTIIGRTWEQFLTLGKEIAEILPDKVYLVVLVHNLSFEGQFLEGIYDFTPDDVFCLASRSILKMRMFDHLELRDTFRHSNMSLEKYLQKFKVEHQKLSGEEFDYSKVRYPWTELTEKELEYASHDVIGLCEAYIAEMVLEHDTLYTIPATSTGYVRREAKRAMKSEYSFLIHQVPDYETYQMLREAFRGGDVHANRYYAGVLLHNVKSFDRSSSYPDVILNCRFPTSKFHPINYDLDKLDLLQEHKKENAIVARIAFTGLRLKNRFIPWPYISRDKCRNIGQYQDEKGRWYDDVEIDNGRVMSAAYLETTITDVDFLIISEVYTWDNMQILSACRARYGLLPMAFTDLVIEFYQAKTRLKGVEGQEYYYNRAKNLLNSLYGMCAQDPLKDETKFIDMEYKEIPRGPADLEKYYKAPFVVYQWGCWVTCWGRFRLYEALRIAGVQAAYWDTDSVKFVGGCDFSKYNAARKKDSTFSGAFADDPAGQRHYMGVLEQEEGYDEFKTLGAKKYVYRQGGKIGVTIAGVNKKKGGPELEKMGGVDAFREGVVFKDAGGTDLIYNDTDDFVHHAPGGDIRITRNVVIINSTYEVGISAEYERLLAVLSGKYRELQIGEFDLSEFGADEDY